MKTRPIDRSSHWLSRSPQTRLLHHLVVRPIVWGLLVVSLIAATSTPSEGTPNEFVPFFSEGETVPFARGTWEIPGYGRVLVVEVNKARLFHLVAQDCLADPTPSEDLVTYIGWARKADADLEIASTARSAPYLARPLDALPDACGRELEPTPRRTFEIFVEAMRKHYAFFDLHGVDWGARVDERRSAVRDDMSDDELFQLLSSMLEGLDDGHTSLEGVVDGEDRRFTGARPSQLRLTLDSLFEQQKKFSEARELRQAWIRSYFRNVRKKLLSKPKNPLDNAVVWGKVKGTNVGYINIFEMAGYSPTGRPEDGQLEVEKIMNEALADLGDVAAMIVDVSFNQGGADEISATFAGHFAPTDVPFGIAYRKRPHDQAGAEFDRELKVHPSTGRRFTGPVTLVTTEQTVSAAETFTMYMRSLPNVTHVGEATAGALSDILDKPLPNGWLLGLSNEIYLDPDGVLWEGRGLPPEREVPIWAHGDDVFESHWTALRGLARELDGSENSRR